MGISETEVSCLSVQDLHLSFGDLKALMGVSFDVGESEILAIIGPNGSGKTCLLNCINGFYRPQKGEVIFMNKKITGLPPYERARLGISRTFQKIELYTGLSTLDNLMAARHHLIKHGLLTGSLYIGWAHKEEIKHRQVVEYIIDFLDLQKYRNTPVGLLSYGIRKRVELGRALALEPHVLLLDEPMAGMNLEEKEDMSRFILDTVEVKKIPIVLVEHDMQVVMDITDRIIVLDLGQKIAEGLPGEIAANPDVVRAYLGD